MTAWVDYPRLPVEFNHGHGVSGRVTLVFTDRNTVIVDTAGAHVNDNNLAVTFRGNSYLVHLALVRHNESGPWTVNPDVHQDVKSRTSWSKATPHQHNTIIAALCDVVGGEWTADLGHRGEQARIAQQLHYLETEREQVATHLTALDKKIYDLTAQQDV